MMQPGLWIWASLGSAMENSLFDLGTLLTPPFRFWPGHFRSRSQHLSVVDAFIVSLLITVVAVQSTFSQSMKQHARPALTISIIVSSVASFLFVATKKKYKY